MEPLSRSRGRGWGRGRGRLYPVDDSTSSSESELLLNPLPPQIQFSPGQFDDAPIESNATGPNSVESTKSDEDDLTNYRRQTLAQTFSDVPLLCSKQHCNPSDPEPIVGNPIDSNPTDTGATGPDPNYPVPPMTETEIEAFYMGFHHPNKVKLITVFKNIREGDIRLCTSTWICSPTEIVLMLAWDYQICQNYAKEISWTYEACEEANPSMTKFPSPEVIKRGSILMAKIDGLYLRCIVDKLPDSESRTYEVFTLDTGDFRNVEMIDFRYLYPAFDFSKQQALAIRVRLPEVEKYWSNTVKAGRLVDWNFVVNEKIVKVFQNTNFEVRFISRNENENDTIWDIEIKNMVPPKPKYKRDFEVVQDIMRDIEANDEKWKQYVKDDQLNKDIEALRQASIQTFIDYGCKVEEQPNKECMNGCV